MLGDTMGIIDKVKSMLEPETDGETVLYELNCGDCDHTYMTETPPEEAECEECGGTDLTEESRMYAGDVAGGGGV
ncbi:MAG: hypothetical protein SVG88_07330 [Halobacteriales archaeon]|nr:hypothetical protein [Halobacteriales archaeon]